MNDYRDFQSDTYTTKHTDINKNNEINGFKPVQLSPNDNFSEVDILSETPNVSDHQEPIHSEDTPVVQLGPSIETPTDGSVVQNPEPPQLGEVPDNRDSNGSFEGSQETCGSVQEPGLSYDTQPQSSPCPQLISHGSVLPDQPQCSGVPDVVQSATESLAASTNASTLDECNRKRAIFGQNKRALSTDCRPDSSNLFGLMDSRSRSVVEELLFDIYDRWHYGHRSFDSDTFTECSSTSDAFTGRSDHMQFPLEEPKECLRLTKGYLKSKGVWELRLLKQELQRHVTVMSTRLIRQLKRKDRRQAKLTTNCDIVTAILQASSLKRRVDSQLRFSIHPGSGDDGFAQWLDAMRAVARLPLGIPHEFRKKVWLALADNYLDSIHVDWDKTKRFAFNDRSNPDDNSLGLQIVKDLHRTGCSGFSGQDNEEERALLKRVLLAYARWNKQVGYCQGFNILAALILDVVERREEEALKVMIYLIDHVLPSSYFANNLRALSVDMAVFRELLKTQLPLLARHLDKLQASPVDDNSGCNYEPPLTNVFTMQWFLTLFATCLPKDTALRIWDSVLLDGSEIILRTALAIWARLEGRVLAVEDADEFYTTMGVLTQEMLDSTILNADSLIKTVYAMAPFPFPQLSELREKFTYNITPFTAAMSTGGQRSRRGHGVTSIFSDDDMECLEDEEIMENIGCFTGMFPGARLSPAKLTEADRSPSTFDMSKVSPGAFGSMPQHVVPSAVAHAERMSLDLSGLKKQYAKVRMRQKQAHIIISAANARHQASLNQRGRAPLSVKTVPATVMAPIESPMAVNHLYLGRSLGVQQGRKNRTVIEAPKISYYSNGGVGDFMRGLPGHSPAISTQRVSGYRLGQFKGTRRCSNSSSSTGSQASGVSGPKSQSDTASLCSEEGRSSILSIDAVISTPCSSRERDSVMSASNSDVSTVCGDNEHTENDLNGREHELCEKVVNEETGEIVRKENDNGGGNNSEITQYDSASSPNSQNECKSDTASLQTTGCDSDLISDSKPSTLDKRSSSHIDSNSPDTEVVQRPNTLQLTPKRTSTATKKYTLHHMYPQSFSSPSDSEEQSPNRETPSPSKTAQTNSASSTSKVFNPFPSQHLNRRRAQNGVRLGLYSADNVPRLEVGMTNVRPVQNIGRQQINACLHRQYMAEVKKQGK